MVERKSKKLVYGILGFAIALVILSPLLYCFSASFMTERELYSNPPNFITKTFYWQNYQQALEIAPLFRFILNSTIVALAATSAQLITGSLAGFAFGCLKFKGQKLLFMLFLATMMIPGQAIIIANYLTIVDLNLIDTFGALIIPYMTSAFCVFNMRQAYLSLPKDLMESATIDGANSFQFFTRVGVPLTLPFLGSLGIYTFLSVWNQYLWPLLVTNATPMRTVQIGLGMLQNADGQSYGPIMAAAIIVLVPSVLVFIIGQKSLITGLTAGAVKG
ncbi:MAG: carbohydrate ABC transporter permease [Clostridia bacterium]